MMFEDASTNRITDALELFDTICNSTRFAATNIVLFLNKQDILTEKVKKVSLKNSFPDFQPSGNSETLAQESQEYLKNLFLSKNKQERKIICKLTCATNTEAIKKVFKESVETIFEDQMP